MEKPIIGIVSKNLTVKAYYNWQWQRISDAVRCALNKNGAMVIGILPQKDSQDFNQEDEHDERIMTESETQMLEHLISMCDGIVLQGGITSHNYEEYIARYCYENNIPCLGICAGFNNMIRGLGGTTTRLVDEGKHNRPDLDIAHTCTVIDKNSLFYKCVKTDIVKVNSIHSYIADVVPKELSVISKSDDGQVEVVEAKNKTFYMGIKYHPELLINTDEGQNNIFKLFVESCAKNKNL